MKKNGFTLAEVLITLAIIGIVAALTVPTLMTDSRYQLVSSRAAKFASTTEDAAMAYAAMNGEITSDELDNILLYKSKNGKMYELKDGTQAWIVSLKSMGWDKPGLIEQAVDTPFRDFAKYGTPETFLYFKHNVSGINHIISSLQFTLTNKGYLFPTPKTCAAAMFDKENSNSTPYKLTKDMTKVGGACYNSGN